MTLMGFKKNKFSKYAKKKRGKTPKSKTWDACSRYIRLRDAITYCLGRGIDLRQFNRPEEVIGKCCTCGTVKAWLYMDAGHCIGRGIGGNSGVYFDERNIGLQCKAKCNAFGQGERKKFEAYLEGLYGDNIMEELERKHKTHIYSSLEIAALGEYFKLAYENLVRKYWK